MERLTKIERAGIIGIILVAATVIGVTTWRNREKPMTENERQESAEQLKRFQADIERFDSDTIAKKKKKIRNKKKRKAAGQAPAWNPLDHKIEKDE